MQDNRMWYLYPMHIFGIMGFTQILMYIQSINAISSLQKISILISFILCNFQSDIIYSIFCDQNKLFGKSLVSVWLDINIANISSMLFSFLIPKLRLFFFCGGGGEQQQSITT